MRKHIPFLGMTMLFVLLFSHCKKQELEEESGSDTTTTDTTVAEILIAPKVIDYAPGYSQFIAERFTACQSKAEILEECTQLLAQERGDITLGGFGGYLVLDLGNQPREKDYTFHFNGNGFDDNYCLISVSDDGEDWRTINGTDEVEMVELAYVKNTAHDRYTWEVDTVKSCRTIGVREICTTSIQYNWDSTAIWSKVINGEEQPISPHASGTPLVYIRAHQGPYFNPYLSTPSGWVPKVGHTLIDSFVVEKEIRYLKFQNTFDSISPIVGEFSPEIEDITILFK